MDKERVRYFQDDDNLSLKDLVRNEKMRTAEDQNKLFMRMASKVGPDVAEFILNLKEMFPIFFLKKTYFQHSGWEKNKGMLFSIKDSNVWWDLLGTYLKAVGVKLGHQCIYWKADFSICLQRCKGISCVCTCVWIGPAFLWFIADVFSFHVLVLQLSSTNPRSSSDVYQELLSNTKISIADQLGIFLTTQLFPCRVVPFGLLFPTHWLEQQAIKSQVGHTKANHLVNI